METETATNPVEAGDTLQETATETQEVETQIEPQYDDEGNPIEPVIEEEEIDLDDLKLKLPKDQAEKVKAHLLRQADYTRKTQELAEQRKAFEAQTQQSQQASQAERQTEAAILAMDAQLAQYANVNWSAEMQAADANFDDAHKARIQAAFMQYTQLRDARGNAAAQYFSLKQQREFQAQQETAKRSEEGRAAVAKIPGWSEQTARELTDLAVKEFGGDPAETAIIVENPVVARLMLYAKKGLEAERNAAKAQQHVQAQQAQPAAKAGGGSSAPPSGVNDKLPIDEWMRRENARVARKRA